MNTNSSLPPAGPQAEPIGQRVRQQAARVTQKLPLLGSVSWLMLANPGTRHTLLSDLEWRVMPALMLQQARLYLRDEVPVAYVSWARLSPEVAQRFTQAPHRLAPADWKSGDQVWLVDVLAPFGGAKELIGELRAKELRGQALYQLAPGSDGQVEVCTWPPMPTA